MFKKPQNDILIVTRSSERGGEAVFISKISEILAEKELEFKIISFLDRSLASFRSKKVFLNPISILKKPFFTLRDLATIEKESADSRICFHFIFDIHSIFFVFASFLRNRNIVSTFHTNLDSQGGARYFFGPLIKFLIVNFTAPFSRKLIFLTNIQINNFRRYSLGKKSFDAKAVAIYNFIDSKNILTTKNIPNSSRLRVLYVGRLTREKGFYDLLQVIDSLKNSAIDFEVVGEGESEEIPDHVKYSGVVENKKLLDFYDKNDILIMPSHNETFSLVVLEAMARGLAIVSSDLPAIREYFKEGINGYLVKPRDISGFKMRLLELMDRNRLAKISSYNLLDAQNFTEKSQAVKYLDLFSTFK